MSTATIAFRIVSPNDPLKSRLFCWASNSEFSGCQIDFQIACGYARCIACKEAKSIRCFTHNITYGVHPSRGVCSWVDSTATADHYTDATKFRLFRVGIPNKKYMMDLFSKQLRKPFDQRGAAMAAISACGLWNPPTAPAPVQFSLDHMQEKQSWFCSELIATALFTAGVFDPDEVDVCYRNPATITPQKLYEMLDLYCADNAHV